MDLSPKAFPSDHSCNFQKIHCQVPPEMQKNFQHTNACVKNQQPNAVLKEKLRHLTNHAKLSTEERIYQQY